MLLYNAHVKLPFLRCMLNINDNIIFKKYSTLPTKSIQNAIAHSTFTTLYHKIFNLMLQAKFVQNYCSLQSKKIFRIIFNNYIQDHQTAIPLPKSVHKEAHHGSCLAAREHVSRLSLP